MTCFDSVTLAPADPILSLTEAFKADPNPAKINLSVGVFVNDAGETPILETVREAEQRILAASASKSYLPMTGSPDYGRRTQELAFGVADPGRIASAHTPGGTGALRVAADFIKQNLETGTVWFSNPTWANHQGIFGAAGLEARTYDYFDAAKLALDYPAFLESIRGIPAGDVVVLHGCCHNPTGADLSPEQWAEVAGIAKSRGWIPLIDFAYQGFGAGLAEDAVGVRLLLESSVPVIVAQSFSKNFGLYQDRVGAIHIVTGGGDEAQRVLSRLKVAIRTSYSNPPAHGGQIVTTILGDPALSARWEQEVAAMRSRISNVRGDFVEALAAAGVERDFGFLREQNGMFSFTGLNAAQAAELREKHSIYIVASGRINVAGITSANITTVARAIKEVIG